MLYLSYYDIHLVCSACLVGNHISLALVGVHCVAYLGGESW